MTTQICSNCHCSILENDTHKLIAGDRIICKIVLYVGMKANKVIIDRPYDANNGNN